jgi:uncharacterized protein (DUF1778 family)
MTTTNRPKRDKQVSVRLSSDDLALLKAAANKSWPDLDVSTASLLLNLARARAKHVLGEEAPPPAGKRVKQDR